MSITDIPAVFRDLLCFAAIGLCLLMVIAWAFSLWERNRSHLILSSVLFFASYLLHQMLAVTLEKNILLPQPEVYRLCSAIPTVVYLLWFAVTLLTGILLVVQSLHWYRTHVSALSVKNSIDSLPTGIAIFREDGSCMLVNETMNRLGAALTGHSVLNGQELLSCLRDSGMEASLDKHRYAFHHNLLEYSGQILHELTADDITDLFQKAEELRAGNAQLASIARKMREHGKNIDETVRSNEILQAKIRIHDDMNRLLLATDKAASGQMDSDELHRVLLTWQNDALLLSRNADRKSKSNTVQDLETLAKLIGIELQWDGTPDGEIPEVRRLFEQAAREAMANAVKHAGARSLLIRVRTDKTKLHAVFTNDGTSPAGAIRESGGLHTLRNLIEQAGGTMAAVSFPRFTLSVSIPLRRDFYEL